jgi:hypothetical protein
LASIQRIVSPLTASSIESAIREGRHFPHAAAKRTSFDALAKHYAEAVLVEFDAKEKDRRIRQLEWWAKQFAGLITAASDPSVLDLLPQHPLNGTLWSVAERWIRIHGGT